MFCLFFYCRNFVERGNIPTFAEKVKTGMMNEERLKEMLGWLEAQGWEPEVCDSRVPFFADTPAPCGVPDMLGDTVQTWTTMPRSFLTMQPEFVVKVCGDSMVDVGIVEGDKVMVETTESVHDGDIVLVMIDGEVTLKCWFEDADGCPWLVPQNEAYEPFPLDKSQDVHVLGVVREIVKPAPRVSYRSCDQRVSRVRRSRMEPRRPSAEQVNQIICDVAPMVANGRQWYAVYRPLVTALAVGEGDYDGFSALVSRVVPGHQHLPVGSELQRMAVQSFAKPVSSWRSDNAPVQGKRFLQYLAIGQHTEKLLAKLP